MTDIPCSIKTLPRDRWVAAAQTAIEINPANAPALPALRAAAPNAVIEPEYAAVLITKYWGSDGVRLGVGFLDNPPADLKRRILSHMNAWGSWCNARFFETANDPTVRIARTDGEGYWSYLGTDIEHIPDDEATMNLQNFTMNTPESEFIRVIRHETGHTLGFPHEHLRQEIIDRIDREKAFDYFGGPPNNWSRAEVEQNVLTPLPPFGLFPFVIATADADEKSIMCYRLPASIMRDGIAVPGGTNITNLDAQFASRIYPGPVHPASVWPNGKIYLFKGSQYVRYDPTTSSVDPGYPLPIGQYWEGFPANFAAGVNAALLWTTGKAYFFKGSQYLRFDLPKDKVDPNYPRPIAGNWPGLWGSGIDAGVVWPNGKAYFFKGSEYVRYDIATDRADIGYPRQIRGNWPGFPASFENRIDAAVVLNNGKAYFFRDNEYIRFDISEDTTDPGYPKPIADRWGGLWAEDIDA